MLRWLAVAALLAAAVVHAGLVGAHLRQGFPEGVLFLAFQVLETGLAVALAVRPGRRVYVAAIAGSLATVAVWIASPRLGVSTPEWELVATGCELATAFALFPLVVRGPLGHVVAGATSILAVAAALTAATGRPSGGAAAAHGGHGGGALDPGEYPLGEPLHTLTRSQGPGFFFEARPLPRYVLELGVGPARVGFDTLDVIVVDHVGNRIEVPRVRVALRPPGRGPRPVRVVAERLSPGHFIVNYVRIPRAGSWRIHVEGGPRGSGRSWFSQTFAVPIGAPAARS